MRVSIVGSGYVGTTLAACLAEFDHDVTAIDIDQAVVDTINDGKSPIHEPGLDELIAKHSESRLRATTDYEALLDTDITFLALPTPSNDDGSIDAETLAASAQVAGETLAEGQTDETATSDPGHLVVIKSTVTPDALSETVLPALTEGVETTSTGKIGIATNPEFLREGSAVSDFRDPDRLVFGTTADWETTRLEAVYAPLIETGVPVVETEPAAAMLIKYASNAFLASKVSLINEIGNIAKQYDIDAYDVANAIGLDDRIGERFLRSGVGFGGSCFPKDVDAIIAAAREQGYQPELLEAALDTNQQQPDRLIDLLATHIDLDGAEVAVLGVAFKPGTDDIRNSQAGHVIESLRDSGATVVAYDPIAIPPMHEQFPDIRYADTAAIALDGAEGACVVTGWGEFAALDAEFDAMETPVVVDGRRIVERRRGITYEGLIW